MDPLRFEPADCDRTFEGAFQRLSGTTWPPSHGGASITLPVCLGGDLCALVHWLAARTTLSDTRPHILHCQVRAPQTTSSPAHRQPGVACSPGHILACWPAK